MTPYMKGLEASRDNVFFRCVEDSTEAIMITDVKGQLVYVNPAWQRIFEFHWDEVIGKTPRLLRSYHQDPNFYQNMWKEIMDPAKGSWRGELVNKSKSGKFIPVELSITPIKQEAEIVGYMGLAVDNREKKEMAAQIFRQDRLASIGLLASGLAHEIGTPLGVVRGRAELLRKHLTDSEAGLNSLEIIIQQIDRVSKLIQNLLRLSRGRQVDGARCNLADVVNESVSLLTQKFRQHGVDIAVNVPQETFVQIEHGLMEQVLINLLVNAVHAIGEACDQGRAENHFVRLNSEQDGEFIKLLISDTGSGISPENQKELFRAFFTTKPVGEGTGLGLSISAQIISENGGELSLYDSQEGQGTTFQIRLKKVTA